MALTGFRAAEVLVGYRGETPALRRSAMKLAPFENPNGFEKQHTQPQRKQSPLLRQSAKEKITHGPSSRKETGSTLHCQSAKGKTKSLNDRSGKIQPPAPKQGGETMNKLLFGATVGMMAGMALMMSPMGKMMRKEVHMGVNKAKQMAKAMENM